MTTKEELVVAKGNLKDGQYRLIGEIMIGKAWVASVLIESIMGHRYLSMSKSVPNVFLNKILRELKAVNSFFVLIVESYRKLLLN